MNNKKWNKLKKVYEEKIYPNLKEGEDFRLKKLKEIFDIIDHNTYSIFSSELEKSLLFNDFSRKNDDDTFYGIYKGVKFKIVETELCSSRGNETQFKGIIITFSLNKKFKGKTLILPKGVLSGVWNFQKIFLVVMFAIAFVLCGCTTGNHVFTILGVVTFAIMVLSVKEQKLQKVFLEDAIIKKSCDVYSTDQVEGRYLLTPAFVERFQNLKSVFNNKKIKCSFYDNKVMFVIPTNDNYFEIDDIDNLSNNLEKLHKFYNEIFTIIEMIDYFKLDKNTKV